MIIGLTGGMSCGKHSIVKFLEEKGFIGYTFSDVINEELLKLGIPITRKSQQDMGNELRNKSGAGIWAKKLIAKMQTGKNYLGKVNSNLKVGEIARITFPSSPNPLQTPHFSVEYKSEGFGDVIDGIRNPGEVMELRKQKDFFLIAIDSPQRIRFERIITRGMERDPKTWEEFLIADKRDFDDGTENGLQIAKCMKMADYVVVNDYLFDEFIKRFSEVLEKIMSKR